MRLLFLSGGDPRDAAKWSGTPFFAYRELNRQFKHVDSLWWPFGIQALRYTRRAFRPFGLDAIREPFVGDMFYHGLKKKIRDYAPDAIFSLAYSAESVRIAEEFPVIHCSDSTFHAMTNYYPGYFSNTTSRTLKKGEALERRMIESSKLLLYSSDWASDSAITDYGADRAKVFTVPFGANLHDFPTNDLLIEHGTVEVCKLLFVGVDWNRKGGDLAVAVLKYLSNRGVKAELHVVGCEPPQSVTEREIFRHGFLDKSVESDREKLRELFSTSTFLIVPSQQEAFGLVFCEASAFGLPVLATRTGGIPTIVEEGINGFTFPLTSEASEYGATILRYLDDSKAYFALRKTSRLRAIEALNWGAWGTRVSQIISNVFEKP